MPTSHEIMAKHVKFAHKLLSMGIKHEEVVLPLTLEEYDVLIDEMPGVYGSEITLMGFKTYIHGLTKTVIEKP